MNLIERRVPTARRAARPGWSLLLLTLALLPRCGGKANPDAMPAASGGSGESGGSVNGGVLGGSSNGGGISGGAITGGTSTAAGGAGGAVPTAGTVSTGGSIGGGTVIVFGGSGGASPVTAGAGGEGGETCEPGLLFEAPLSMALYTTSEHA